MALGLGFNYFRRASSVFFIFFFKHCANQLSTHVLVAGIFQAYSRKLVVTHQFAVHVYEIVYCNKAR